MHFYLCFLFSNIKMGKVGSKYHLSCCLGVTEFLRLLSASISASCCFPAGSSSAGYLLSCRWGPLGSLAAAFAHLQELEMHLKAAIRSKHLKAAQCSYLVFILKAPSPLPCKDGACPCHSKGSRHWPTRQRQLPLIKGQQELHPHAPSKDKLSSTCGHSILPKLSVGPSPPPPPRGKILVQHYLFAHMWHQGNIMFILRPTAEQLNVQQFYVYPCSHLVLMQRRCPL